MVKNLKKKSELPTGTYFGTFDIFQQKTPFFILSLLWPGNPSKRGKNIVADQ